MLLALKQSTPIFALLCLATTVAVAQNAPPLTQSIEVSVNGTRLKGTAEIGPLLAGKPTADQHLIFDQAVRSIRRNESFQLVVASVSPNGARIDISGSTRLRYVSDGCLIISNQGFVSVVTTDRCVGSSRPSFVVSLLSSDLSSVVGLNEYFFLVTD